MTMPATTKVGTRTKWATGMKTEASPSPQNIPSPVEGPGKALARRLLEDDRLGRLRRMPEGGELRGNLGLGRHVIVSSLPC